MNKYLIDYENAHWCGGNLYVVVNAVNETDAEIKAADWMEETQRELYVDEYGESISKDEEYADECAYSVNSVELFTPEHTNWKWYKDPGQAEFYPEI
jgi:hypothetical protein